MNHIDKRDFEVIIHQEKCIASGLYKGYKCRCKQDAINKRTLRPKDDTYFGKVNIVDAKVNYTVGKNVREREVPWNCAADAWELVGRECRSR